MFLPVLPQIAEPLDPLRWITAGDAFYDLPWTAWTATKGLAIGNGKGIDLIDPRTGGRRPLVAEAEFSAATKAAGLGDVDTGRPEGYDPTLRRLVYRAGSRIAVFDVAKRRFATIDSGAVPSMALSPDGTRLAYAKDRDLYVWSSVTGRSTRLTNVDRPRLLNGVLTWVYWEEIRSRMESAFAWSPDSKRLAYLQTDESPVKSSAFVDFDAVPPTVHAQTYPFAGGPNPKVRVGVVAASGGPTTWLQPGSAEYLTRFGWTPKGASWVLSLNRRQTHAELWQCDAKTGLGRRLLFDDNPQWVNSTDDVHFLPDGTILMNSQRDGYDRLYRWSPQGTILNAVTPPKRSLAKPLFATHGLRWVDPKGETIMFSSGDPQRFESQLQRIRTDGGSLADVTTEPGSHAVLVSPDGEFYVDRQSRLDEPPRLVLRRVDGRTISVLSERRPLPAGYARAQIMRVRAHDGFPLPAYVRLPPGYDPAKRYPAVAYVYGGPGLPLVNDSWQGTGDQVLASAGYVVFVVDPRSSTLLDERLARGVKGRAVGTSEVNDLVDAVRWLKKLPYVDPARVGVWGWSGGGSFTLLALTRSKEFAAGVAVAPVTDWRYYDTVYAERLMGLPRENAKGYNATALWRDARNLHGRLLMMYGTHDDNVHPINEEKFLDALIKAGKTAEVMVFPNRKHDIGDPAAYSTVYRTMLDFFRRSL